MKNMFFGISLSLIGAAFVPAQETPETPDWIGKDPYVEDGLIYFTGYSKMANLSLSMSTVQPRAMTNLVAYLRTNSHLISEFPSIPADAKGLSTFTSTFNGIKVEGTLSGVTMVKRWSDADDGIHALCSCTGVELDRKPQNMSTSVVQSLKYTNGDLYEGDVVNGKKHGKGKYTYAAGGFYEGDYADDKKHGKGKYTSANGNVYEGDFADGRYNGRGKYTSVNGDVYEGDFVNNKKHGKGKYTYATGDVYEGDFADDKYNGKGKYVWTNGQVYEGDWADGNQNGMGKMILSDGAVKDGNWKDGKFAE